MIGQKEMRMGLKLLNAQFGKSRGALGISRSPLPIQISFALPVSFVSVLRFSILKQLIFFRGAGMGLNWGALLRFSFHAVDGNAFFPPGDDQKRSKVK